MVKKSIDIFGSNILIMGFAFKENCPDIRTTGVLNIYNELIDYECKIDIYDPIVNKKEVFQEYGIEIYDEIPHKKYSGILIAVGHTCFKEKGIKNIKKYARKNSIILDIKYLFNQNGELDFL